MLLRNSGDDWRSMPPVSFRRGTLFAVLLLACVSSRHCSTVFAQAQADHHAVDRVISDAELERYTQRLGDPSYQRREAAMRFLESAGPAAIGPLERAIADGNLEVVDRASQIIQTLASLETPSDPPNAWEALKRVAQFGPGSAATRADSAINLIEEERGRRARQRLIAAGLQAGLDQFFLGTQLDIGEKIEFPSQWTVDEEALTWFPWMYNTTAVLIHGTVASDQVLDALVELPNLRKLKISDGQLTANQLRRLGKLKRIDVLELHYVDVGNGEDDLFSLAALPLREKLFLTGTKFDLEDVEALRGNLQSLEIVYSQGGFLGVRCYPVDVQCEVSGIVANSAADRAGLIEGDVIIQFGEQPIGKFAELLEAVRQYPPGSKVELKVKRRGVERTLEIELGRFDSSQTQ